MTRQPVRSRSAFTLIELLIVIGIISVLATLAFLFLPNLDKNKGVPNAATQIEGYIRLSKAQALRDGAQRGVRLLLIDSTDPRYDASNPYRVGAIQYIEQPDPVAPRGGVILTVQAVTNMMTGVTTSTAVLNAGDTWDVRGVQVGDFLEISASPYAIVRIKTVSGLNLELDQPVDGTNVTTGGTPLNLTDGYRVIRAPRPLVGEPTVQLHKDVYIDLPNSYPTPTATPGNTYTFSQTWAPSNNFDILFNSSGTVANATSGQIILCVQHVDRPIDKLLVVVYTRTGKVTAVIWNDVGGADPYLYARDGRGSGI